MQVRLPRKYHKPFGNNQIRIVGKSLFKITILFLSFLAFFIIISAGYISFLYFNNGIQTSSQATAPNIRDGSSSNEKKTKKNLVDKKKLQKKNKSFGAKAEKNDNSIQSAKSNIGQDRKGNSGSTTLNESKPINKTDKQNSIKNVLEIGRALALADQVTDWVVPLKKNNKGNPANRVTSDKADKTISYVIKMSTHPYRLGAESSSGNFKGKGFDTVIYRDENNWFNVGIGYFKSRSRANEVVLKLKKLKNFYGEIVAIKTKNPKKK